MRLSAIKDILPALDNVEFRLASGRQALYPKEQTDRLSCSGCLWHASGGAKGKLSEQNSSCCAEF